MSSLEAMTRTQALEKARSLYPNADVIMIDIEEKMVPFEDSTYDLNVRVFYENNDTCNEDALLVYKYDYESEGTTGDELAEMPLLDNTYWERGQVAA